MAPLQCSIIIVSNLTCHLLQLYIVDGHVIGRQERLLPYLLNGVESLAMALNDVIDDFSNTTSMHGVPKAIRAKSKMARAFWTIVCLVATSMFVLQVSERNYCLTLLIFNDLISAYKRAYVMILTSITYVET